MKVLVDKKRSTRKVFTRTWDEEKKSYDYSGEKFNLQEGFEKLLRGECERNQHGCTVKPVKKAATIVTYWLHGCMSNVAEAGMGR